MALSEGHQCHPSFSKPPTMAAPERPREGAAPASRSPRVGRVAGNTGDADILSFEVVERLEDRRGDRPVIGDSVETMGAEVGRVKAREVPFPCTVLPPTPFHMTISVGPAPAVTIG